MSVADRTTNVIPLGIGYYTVPEAARLLGMPARNVRRWMGGYAYKNEKRGSVAIEPLWTPQLPRIDDQLQLGFRDLIELRFVQAFTDAGVGLKHIRNCLDLARQIVNDSHPFSTQRFRTDGRSIFLESLDGNREDPDVLDLRKNQYVFARIIAKFFKDLDIDDDAVSRWRPYQGRLTIVIDPQRAFGQPIANSSGIPTETLFDALQAEGSIKRVARLYDVDPAVLKDVQSYQKQLMAA